MGLPILKGSTFGRYTVTGPAPSVFTSGCNRSRVWVECACGHKSCVLQRDLRIGRTSGCRSQRCREAWKEEQARRDERLLNLRDALDELAELCPEGTLEAAVNAVRQANVAQVMAPQEGARERAAVLRERCRRALLSAQEMVPANKPEAFEALLSEVSHA